VELPGLEGDVIALPCGGGQGGDLYALFSCGAARYARIVLADAVGHGFTASEVARQVHALLHRYEDIRDTAALLAALNDTFAPTKHAPEAPLHLTTVVTATYHRDTGEFNYAYAAHPRMLFWKAREAHWHPLGEGLENLPLGVIAGETYSQQSVRLEPGDMALAFSDGLTEVGSPEGEQLGAKGFLRLANQIFSRPSPPTSLHDVAEGLLDAVGAYHGSDHFKDDLTLLLLRRSS
jgi:sigma-B regulation protein RsbU (phosphoserine phosphatase)